MSSFLMVIRSSSLSSPRSAIWNASTSTGILITLALLNSSMSWTPAVSPVVRCLTQMPALPGNSATVRARNTFKGDGCSAARNAVRMRTRTATAAFTGNSLLQVGLEA